MSEEHSVQPKSIVFLTGVNSQTSLLLVQELINKFSEFEVSVLFEYPNKTFRSVVRGQIKNIKYHGLLWIPYRLCVAFVSLFSKIFAFNKKEMAEKLLDNPDCLSRVTFFENLSSQQAISLVNSKPSILGIVFGTSILAEEMFSAPQMGMINLHQGLIPEFRGQPPAFWEIYKGNDKSGVTIHRVVKQLDAGEVIFTRGGASVS